MIDWTPSAFPYDYNNIHFDNPNQWVSYQNMMNYPGIGNSSAFAAHMNPALSVSNPDLAARTNNFTNLAPSPLKITTIKTASIAAPPTFGVTDWLKTQETLHPVATPLAAAGIGAAIGAVGGYLFGKSSSKSSSSGFGGRKGMSSFFGIGASRRKHHKHGVSWYARRVALLRWKRKYNKERMRY